MGKARKGTTARRQTKAVKGGNKSVRASDEPITEEREWLWRIRNRVCFTFSLDNNSDILMLIKK